VNVLLVTTDQQKATTIGAYGNPLGATLTAPRGGRRQGGEGGGAENGGSVNNRAFMRPTLRSTHPTRRIPAFAGMEYR
jgi:hypothetical protein